MKKLITMILMLAVLTVSALNTYAAQQVNGVVNINSATKAQLVLVPGIGEAKAQAIIDQRKAKPFAAKSDLLAIKGIGEKMLSKISPYISLNGSSTIEKQKKKSQ